MVTTVKTRTKIIDNYVFQSVPNAFNDRSQSVWVSKRDYTLAAYCFSLPANDWQAEKEWEYQLENAQEQYIRRLEEMLHALYP